MSNSLMWIPLVPFIGFLFLTFFGKSLKGLGPWLATLAIGTSHLLAWCAWCTLSETGSAVTYSGPVWLAAGNFSASFSFYFDGLSGIMTLFITGIATLIHLYSVGYMADDDKPYKFFSYLNLFCGMMLMLVLGDSLPVLFLGWEGVGLCSYLLIGYWHKDMANAEAAQKAFVANRIGDFFFLIGMFLLCSMTGFESLNFSRLLDTDFIAAASINPQLPWALLCLFLGACGKSAQIPLYVWLPDAMAGPTPVSALIHAATMVTSGLYLVARLSPLFELSSTVGYVIIIVGTLTAFVSALIALTQTDIKKVLAYSTVSQLGYMFVAMGCGAYAIGIFHVFTHAFFKALLFLGSGSVIHACHHEQDMREMGGLGSKTPLTHLTMLIGTLAITGFPFLSGFYSKEAILTKAIDSGHGFIYALLLLTAILTSFYMFRLYFLTFKGEYRGHAKPHESPWTMTVPLVILAIGSILAGVLGNHRFEAFLNDSGSTVAFVPSTHTPHGVLVALGLFAFAAGLFFAYKRYGNGRNVPEPGTMRKGLLTNASYQKFYVDEVYNAFLLTPLMNAARFCYRLGDRIIIEGLVNGLPKIFTISGAGFKLFQNGRLGHYAVTMALGVTIALIYVVSKVLS